MKSFDRPSAWICGALVLLATTACGGWGKGPEGRAGNGDQTLLSADILVHEYACLKGVRIALKAAGASPVISGSGSGALPSDAAAQGDNFEQDPATATWLSTKATPSREWANRAFFLISSSNRVLAVMPPDTQGRSRIAKIGVPVSNESLWIQVLRAESPQAVAFGKTYRPNSVPFDFEIQAQEVRAELVRPGVVSTISIELTRLGDLVRLNPESFKSSTGLKATLDSCDKIEPVIYNSDAGTLSISLRSSVADLRTRLGISSAM